jgi:Uncharacterized protein conserved in bacteria (DUF2330)
MKKTLIGSAVVLATMIGLLSCLRHPAVGCYAVSPRNASGSRPTPIEINTETALIVWDAEHKVQHFIRKATFQTKANHFGFLVPTPTKPELAEAKDAIFSKLSSITAPMRPPRTFAAPRSMRQNFRAQSAVTVLETKQVAGFEASILAATDPKALNEWLAKHDYESGPELNDWLKPYIEQGWIITAFKIAKSKPTVPTVGSTAVRMSFQTDRPFFPYREPAPKAEEPLVAEEVIARQPAEAQQIIRKLLARTTEQQQRIDALAPTRRFRALRVYFLADRAFQGHLGDADDWNGRTLYSQQLSDQHRQELLGLLEIESFQPSRNLWLTEFLDTSIVRKGNKDLFFSALE